MHNCTMLGQFREIYFKLISLIIDYGVNWCKGVELLRPLSLDQPSIICLFSHLQETSQNIPFRLGSLPPPRRQRCAKRPVDVTEWLQRLRIWTPIWLLHHWAWLCRRYWRYRNLIWLIFWLIKIINISAVTTLEDQKSFYNCLHMLAEPGANSQKWATVSSALCSGLPIGHSTAEQ